MKNGIGNVRRVRRLVHFVLCFFVGCVPVAAYFGGTTYNDSGSTIWVVRCNNYDGYGCGGSTSIAGGGSSGPADWAATSGGARLNETITFTAYSDAGLTSPCGTITVAPPLGFTGHTMSARFGSCSVGWTSASYAQTNYTNYSLNHCFTNNGLDYIVMDPKIITGSGTFPIDNDGVLGGALGPALPPKGYRCFNITNSDFFELQYYGNDNVLITVTPPPTVTTGYLPPPHNSQMGGQGSIVGTNGYGGSAGGSTNAFTQGDGRMNTDALILAIGANAQRIVSAIQSNSAGDVELDYTAVLHDIKTNTYQTWLAAAFGTSNLFWQNLQMSNDAWGRTNLGASQLSAASNSWGTATGALGGFNEALASLNYGGSLSNLSQTLPALLVSSPTSGWGVVRVAGFNAETLATFDIGSAINLNALTVWVGSGTKTWIRLALLWLGFLTLFIWYSDELRRGVVEINQAQQLQTNANSGGVLSLLPGVNVSIRAVMVAIVVAAIALFPAIVTAMVGTGVTLANHWGSMSDAVGGVGVTSSMPSYIKVVLFGINEWCPVLEWIAFGLNALGAKVLMNTAVALLNTFNKVFGV